MYDYDEQQPEPQRSALFSTTCVALVFVVLAAVIFGVLLLDQMMGVIFPQETAEEEVVLMPTLEVRPTQTPLPNTYVHYRANYSVQYPVTWRANEIGEEEKVLLYDLAAMEDENDPRSAQEGCEIEVLEDRLDQSMEEYMTRFMSADEVSGFVSTEVGRGLSGYTKVIGVEQHWYVQVARKAFFLRCWDEGEVVQDNEDVLLVVGSFAPVAVPTPSVSVSPFSS
jgi:hypothetical protein